MTAVAHTDHRNAGAPGLFNRQFHGAMTDNHTHAPIAIEQRSGCAFGQNPDVRPGRHRAFGQPLRIPGMRVEANHTMRIHTAQIRSDEHLCGNVGVARRHTQLFEAPTDKMREFFVIDARHLTKIRCHDTSPLLNLFAYR